MSSDPRTVCFGDFVLDLSRCSLRRGDTVIPLRPKSFDVLRYLAENAGRLIAKDEIIAAVWPGVVVTDDSLVQCVKDVREALDDTDHRTIETVQRRGYLFAAEVSSGAPLAVTAAADATSTQQLANARRFRWWPRLAFAAVAALIVVVIAVGVRLVLEPKITSANAVVTSAQDATANAGLPAQRQSIAVLPLVSLSPPGGDDYFADGMTEDIIAALGRFPEIAVRSRNAVFQYKGKSPPPDEVGRDLDVRYLVEGSIRRSTERVRISIQLTDTTRAVVLWSEQYDAAPTDIFAVHDDITRRIAGVLAVQLSDLELARAAAKPPNNLESYDLVLRGRDLLARVTRTANFQARSAFERAIALDRAFVPAYVGLGLVEFNALSNGWTAAPAEALQRAESLGRKAVQLDESHPGAHALLGRVYYRRGEYDRALDELRRAVALNPSDADSEAGLGGALLWTGEVEGAIRALEMAAELQTQLLPTDSFYLATAYLLAGRSADAIRTLERSIVGHSSVAYTNALLAAAYAEAGRGEDAASQAEIARKLSPSIVAAEFGSRFRNPEHREKIVAALQKAGF